MRAYPADHYSIDILSRHHLRDDYPHATNLCGIGVSNSRCLVLVHVVDDEMRRGGKSGVDGSVQGVAVRGDGDSVLCGCFGYKAHQYNLRREAPFVGKGCEQPLPAVRRVDIQQDGFIFLKRLVERLQIRRWGLVDAYDNVADLDSLGIGSAVPGDRYNDNAMHGIRYVELLSQFSGQRRYGYPPGRTAYDRSCRDIRGSHDIRAL